MKSGSNDFQKQLKGLSEIEKRNALKWISSLTPKKRAEFEQVARVQVAQVLMEAYLKQKASKTTPKKNKLKRKA